MINGSGSIRRAWPVIPLALLLSGCEAIEGIFKAGVWTGILLVVIAVALIGFVLSRVRS